MDVRKAEKNDAEALYYLLETVQQLHAEGRPDIFKSGASKYTVKQIEDIISGENTPVFVLAGEDNKAVGYSICSVMEEKETNNLYAKKTLYIDDLCVGKDFRRQGYGKKLYEYTLSYAKSINCDRLTLNVWHLNENAVKFYETLGMSPLKTTMEQKL